MSFLDGIIFAMIIHLLLWPTSAGKMWGTTYKSFKKGFEQSSYPIWPNTKE